MTRLYLVRHGQTIWHTENRYAGTSDVPLDETGRLQAHKLGQWAATAGLAAIISSPLSRARKTALPASQATGLPIGIAEGLIETHFGMAEGRTLAEMRTTMPDAAAAFERDPAENPWPGAERPEHAARRAVAALREIAARHTGPVLVVAHNTLIRLALCRLLGLPVAEYRRIFPAIRNCALNEIAIDSSAASLLSLNVSVSQ